MEPDKNTSENPPIDQPSIAAAPADALSRTPDELEQDQSATASQLPTPDSPPEKKISPFKRFIRKTNIYFLIFILIVIAAIIFSVVSYLNSQKPPVEPNIANQPLSQEALKQLANTDASVGGTNQTLTIQGNAIIAGQGLVRGALNVAGNIQTSGSLQASELTISGSSNLGSTQINSLQVATNTAVQGNTTLRNLSVSGSAAFSGAMTASEITTSRLTLSGNAILTIPNHIGFGGPSPTRTINTSVLGGGGTASIDGSDTTGTININTGNGPQAGCFARINFHQPFLKQPHVIVSPIGSGAGLIQYYVDRDKAGFSICTNNASPANRVFAFDYFVTS